MFHCRKLFSRLARRNDGVAAIEFALLAGVLVTLFLGVVEMTRFILVQQKIDKTAVTISDMVSQGSTISTAELDQILDATDHLMAPYSFDVNGVVIVSSVYRSGSSTTVRWQRSGGGTLSRISNIGIDGGEATLPGGLTLNDRDNVIVAEVFYRFTPILGEQIVSTQDVYKVGFFKPRLGDLTTLN